MLVVMQAEAGPQQVADIVTFIESMGYTAHAIPGSGRTAIGITGNDGSLEAATFSSLPGVAKAISVSNPFKLVSREVKPEPSVVHVGDAKVGGGGFTVMAGPCAVESEEQILACARKAAEGGATFLRGGAFKPRTSPYSFQGLKEKGLELLALAREDTGLKVITEVVNPETVNLVASYADMMQVGARNMQNFALLEAVGDCGKPVMLKRGLSATLQELLMAAEYIASRGNYNIVLCERGIRTFEPMTRNTLDLSAIPVLRSLTHLPLMVDPSHGIGRRDGIIPLARASVAVGADGAMVEIHPDPAKALSDGPQALTFPMFTQMMKEVNSIAGAMHANAG